MALEIEGKWLASNFQPGFADIERRIRQGYVALDPNGTNVRVRQDGAHFTMTTKNSSRKGVKTELELGIEADTFEEYWALTEGRRVEKIRYRVPLIGHVALGGVAADSLVAEVDVFGGEALAGLVMVEVETPTLEVLQAVRSQPASWFGLDVTDDPRYTNAWLAANGLPS